MFRKERVVFQRYKPYFTTADGIVHEGHTYKWINPDWLECTIPECLMIRINSEGYIEDKSNAMYLLSNIISIDWKKCNEVDAIGRFPKKLFFTTKELRKYANALIGTKQYE